MKSLAIAVLLASLAGPCRAAFSGRDAGTASGQFLKLGADARAAGMGHAVRALCDDANAVYWNPAGLAGLRYRHATMTHAAYYQSVFYDFIAYAQPIESVLDRSQRGLRPDQLGAVGVALFYLNAGPLGEVDNTGTPTGNSFTPQDFAAMAGWGGSLTRYIDVGMGVKYISAKLHTQAATGAVDLGARLKYRLGSMPYVMALSAHNIGGSLKFVQQADPLPLQIVLSQSLRPTKNLAVTADVVAVRDSATSPSFGVEYRHPLEPNMSVAGRMGYEGRAASDLEGLSGLALGGGFSFARFSFDYAWMPYGLLGDAHRMSLSYRF